METKLLPVAYSIKCPLCGAKARAKEQGKAYYWSCSDCPFIGFEFIEDADAEALAEALITHEDNHHE